MVDTTLTFNSEGHLRGHKVFNRIMLVIGRQDIQHRLLNLSHNSFFFFFFLKINLLGHLHADYMFFQMYDIYWFT